MPQISFTKNNEHVYDRFSRLLLEEQLKRGKLTAPQMLEILIEGFEALEAQSCANPTLRQSGAPQFTTLIVNNFVDKYFPLENETK